MAKEALFNIANGMTAQAGVNVESPKEVGEKIISTMIGKSTDAYKSHKAD